MITDKAIMNNLEEYKDNKIGKIQNNNFLNIIDFYMEVMIGWTQTLTETMFLHNLRSIMKRSI